MSQYYTAEEVMKLLNISKATLQRRADEGILPSELEPGKKKGRKYPKEAIDVHLKMREKPNAPAYTFAPSTNNDLWAGYQNSKKLYEPEDIVSYEVLLEWRKANPNIFMTAKEDGIRAGGITIIPVDEETILSLIDDKIKEQDIPGWAIRKWTEKNLTAYIPSISISHTPDNAKNKERGLYIIRNTIRWAFSLNKQYDIKKWYAIAATEEGEKLVNHLGFRKINGKKNAYILADFESATKPIRSFLDTLELQADLPIPKEMTAKKAKATY